MVPSFKHNEVVLVLSGAFDKRGVQLKEDECATNDHETAYTVFFLTEPGRTIDSGDSVKPWELEVCHAQSLPQDILDAFLVSETPSHLSSGSKDAERRRDVHVVISEKSGTGGAMAFYNTVLKPLLGGLGMEALGLGPVANKTSWEGLRPLTNRLPYKICTTENPHSIYRLARDLSAQPRPLEKTIVLLSGDGGMVEFLNGYDAPTPSGATRPKLTVALLPFGTGNALFHSLHKPHYACTNPSSTMVLALRTLFLAIEDPAPLLPTFHASFSPGAKPVIPFPSPIEQESDNNGMNEAGPSMTANGLFGAVVASNGFHAQLVWESDSPAYRVHGSRRFGMAAAELLKLSHSYDCLVEGIRFPSGDDEWQILPPPFPSSSMKYTYVLATLVSSLEKTFTISPLSKVLDGSLRLVWFGDVGAETTMQIMMDAYQEGSHVETHRNVVGYGEFERIRVTTREEDPKWRKVCVDGTIVELEKGGWMEVRKVEEAEARLRVMIRRGGA